MPIALFGITNDALNLVVNLLVLFLVVVWLALIAWTYFDARRRLEDPVLIACATGASLFPFVGTIVYSILRPPEFIEDKRERELEIRASELRLRQLEEQSCPNCEHPVERSFLRCPNCRARIKDPCESCGKPIDPRWSICPYCETPVRRAAPQPRQTQAAPSKGRQPQPAPSKGRQAQPAGSRRSSRPSSGRSSSQPRTGTRKPASGSASSSRSGGSGSGGDTAERPAAPKKSRRSGRRSQGSRRGGGEDKPRPATAS